MSLSLTEEISHLVDYTTDNEILKLKIEALVLRYAKETLDGLRRIS